MKTWVEKSTGKRYPDRGYASWFREVTKDGKRVKFFIRGEGWKKAALSKWQQEEIPDLPERHTLAEFRAYAQKYGIACAQEFLPVADICKRAHAAVRLDPRYPSDELEAWGKEVFNVSLRSLGLSLLWMFGRFEFDVVGFESVLARFGYDPKADESMENFMCRKFGPEVLARFKQELL